MVKYMLSKAELPNKHWGEAVMTAIYLQYRLPTKATEETPYELWLGHKQNKTNPQSIWNQSFCTHIYKKRSSKLDSRAKEGIMFALGSKRHRFLNPTTNKVSDIF